MSVGASDSAGHLEGSAAIFASAFRGQWKPVYRSMSYRLAIVASAAFVLLMPLVYFATIGGIGWLVYWHLTNDTGLLHTRTSGRAVLVPLFLYIVPAIVGCVLILFLLKPILYFFMGPSEEDAIEIFPSEEPRLFGFVAAVCSTMGAPVPERIFIDCTPNAAAQLLGGPLGILGRSRLGLHIGLPLVAGMNATNFAGVLAHEFGHFSQGAGMRATNILGRITQWMMIAAYARDGLDEKIAELGKSGNAYLAILALVLTMCLGIARLVLKVVLFSGYGLARVMG
ncbi:MAG: M48 family metallopeptidase, partial [Phycisphaerae bacterium]